MELQNIADILTASEASKTAFVWGIVDNEHQQPTTSKMVFALRANNRAVKNWRTVEDVSDNAYVIEIVI
jgi:hypothetical protein